MRAIHKCNFYWIWATVSKVMGIYVNFTKTTHQIWSCQVTLASNVENFYFLPSSVLNFRKSYQFGGKLAQEQKRYKQKTNWGWKTPPPPSAYRVRDTSTDVSHSPVTVQCQPLLVKASYKLPFRSWNPIRSWNLLKSWNLLNICKCMCFSTDAFSAKHNKLSFYNPWILHKGVILWPTSEIIIRWNHCPLFARSFLGNLCVFLAVVFHFN